VRPKGYIEIIQRMFAPVLGCKPEDVEVGEGYAVVKGEKRKLEHEWETFVMPDDKS
jgi:hypothetical protein